MEAESKIMKREFELRIAPLVTGSVFKKITEVLDPTLEINVQNIGTYPIKLDFLFVKYWHREKPSEFRSFVKHIDKWLEKDISFIDEITLDFKTLDGFFKVSDMEENAMACIHINFYDIEGKKFKRLDDKIVMF